MNRRLLSIILVWLAGTAACAASDPLPDGIMRVAGSTAPALQLNNLDGEPYDLADTAGRWRFVHFWASWCGPCRREMPSIQRMHEQAERPDIDIVLVNTAETEDEVFSFLAAVAPDLVPLLDRDGLVTEQWQPRGLPATYLVDPEGRIQYQALGGREWEKPAYTDFLRALAATNGTPNTGTSHE